MESSQDKDLPATERKLQKTRKDGQAARSRDLSHLAVLGVGAVALLLGTQPLMHRLREGMGQQLSFDAAVVRNPAQMLERMQDFFSLGLLACVLFGVPVVIASAASAILSGGWIFSFKPVTPQFSRINPLAGIGNLFTKQQLVTVVKMLILSTILVAIAWSYISHGIQPMAATVMQPSAASLGVVGDWIAQGVALLLLVVFAVAVIDVPLQIFLFKSRLKMSHQEVKQEHKESDGNPQIKGKIRQKQREIAQRASINKVPRADFVVTNPTHYAVALRYDDKTMAAPEVVAMGADLLALKIREVAAAHQIPVLESPMLARALYAHAELDQAIPAKLYTAVAQVLAYVYRLKAALRGEGQMPGDLPQPEVPPELDPHHRRPVSESPAA